MVGGFAFMAWVYLTIAGLLEIGFATSLKYTNGFTRFWPTVTFLLFGSGSFYLLTMSLKTIPIGTAYAVWTGIGAVGTVIVGMIFMNEPRDWARFLCIALIIAGIVGLKIGAPAEAKTGEDGQETGVVQTQEDRRG